jgi:hypothetical protein
LVGCLITNLVVQSHAAPAVANRVISTKVDIQECSLILIEEDEDETQMAGHKRNIILNNFHFDFSLCVPGLYRGYIDSYPAHLRLKSFLILQTLRI